VRKRERELLILFLKEMTGALAPFSYLVLNNSAKMSEHFCSFFEMGGESD
jgi:hypothetical protein